MKTQDIEFLSAEKQKQYQEKRLHEQLLYLSQHSPYYQRIFKQNNIRMERIRTIEDLQLLPFTDKKDLFRYNDDFLCCEKDKIIDIVTTSGTMGEPVSFYCSSNDLDRLALNEYKSFVCAGVTPRSVVQLMITLDKRFMAGLAYFNGLRKLGAAVVRVGNGIPELQWDTIQRLQPDTIMCVPSFVLRLIDYARTHNIDFRCSSVRRIIGVGEGLRNQDLSLNMLGERIQELWPEVQLFATYSSTEMSATFSECPCGCGGHVHPELIIVEIIGEDNKPVADGEVGEVVVTTLGVEAMPLLRFRTGDMAAKITEPCGCGRHSYRLTPLVGRKHNMIKLKGTTLYPPAINDVLNNTEYVENFVVVARSSALGTDDVVVRIGLKNVLPVGLNDEESVIKDLKDRFRARLRVTPDIEVLPVDVIRSINFPAKSRKPVLFMDER